MRPASALRWSTLAPPQALAVAKGRQTLVPLQPSLAAVRAWRARSPRTCCRLAWDGQRRPEELGSSWAFALLGRHLPLALLSRPWQFGVRLEVAREHTCWRRNGGSRLKPSSLAQRPETAPIWA